MILRDKILVGMIALEMTGFAAYSRMMGQDFVRRPAIRVPAKRSEVLGRLSSNPALSRATYILVEFGDYECPPCIAAAPAVRQLLKRYDGTISFAFRHFPQDSIHPHAVDAAVVVEQARQLGRDRLAHDLLLNLRGNLTRTLLDDVLKTAREGISVADLSKSEWRAIQDVERDRASAISLGLQGTPSFILCCPEGDCWLLGSLDQVDAIATRRLPH